MDRPKFEVADVFRRYGAAYRLQHGASLSVAQRRVMTASESCRTAVLGGHLERCDQCGFELSGPAAARVRHEAVCKAAGFFTPNEVKTLRNQLGLSQEDFARLAGVGVATVSRVERGRLIQNRSTDNLFRLIAESEEARRLLGIWVDARGDKRTEVSTGPAA